MSRLRSTGRQEGPICQHGWGLQLSMMVGSYPQACWIEEPGTNLEMVSLYLVVAAPVNSACWIPSVCLSVCLTYYTGHTTWVSELCHPWLTRHGPLVLLFILSQLPRPHTAQPPFLSEASSSVHTCFPVTGPACGHSSSAQCTPHPLRPGSFMPPLGPYPSLLCLFSKPVSLRALRELFFFLFFLFCL